MNKNCTNIKTKLLAIIFISVSLSCYAQELSNIPGAFVDIGLGARPIAMGGAFVSLANDVNSVIWNPAGISNIPNKQIGFSFANQFGLINYHSLAFTTPLNNMVDGVGAAIIYSEDEAFKELTMQVSYARKFENLSVGLSLKYRHATFGNNTLKEEDYVVFTKEEIAEGISNQVKGNANGYGIDFGLIYSPNERINFGLMIRDIYSPVYWSSKLSDQTKKSKGNYTEQIPMETVVGSLFKVSDNFIVTADYNPSLINDQTNKVRTGIEGKFFDILFIRGGYQKYFQNHFEDKYIAGLGLHIKIYNGLSANVDYAYMIEEIANSHRFSLALEF